MSTVPTASRLSHLCGHQVQSVFKSQAASLCSLGRNGASSPGFSSCSSPAQNTAPFFSFSSCALSLGLGDRKSHTMSLHPSLSIFHTNQGLMSLRVQHSDLYSRPWQLLACVLVWGRHGWEKHIDHTSVYPPASLKKQTVLACLFLFCTCRNRSSKELAHLSSIPFTPLVWDPVSNSREG